MRKCLRNGNMLAFSMGFALSFLLPPHWLMMVLAVLLVIISFVCSRKRCRC